ncbi:MAG: helix-turn-helix domain-containing protein [Candidatus Micrarchaeia archaeon]
MPSRYELANNEIIPVIRLELANELRNRYKLKQQQIAKKLEITQAEVSKYINQKSASLSKKIEKLKEKLEANRDLINNYAELLTKRDEGSSICELCQKLGGFNCPLSKLRLAKY